MPDLIISDTSCLIVLSNINHLDLLRKVYREIIITPEIVEEYGENLPYWIKMLNVKHVSTQRLLELQLDKGESSAIALAIENPASTIILDDNKARKIARQLGLKVTGTIGVIVKAKLIGIIPSIKPILKEIKKTDFRLSSALEHEALKQAGEE